MDKIGIFLAGQQGDILSASSVLKYRNELWGESEIIWFMEERNFDLLKYQDIELRVFPRGFGYPEMVEEENWKLLREGKKAIWEDWAPLMDENNHLNIVLAKKFPSLEGIGMGYFPAPHQMTPERRHGLSYPQISKKVFGVPDSHEWHPVLEFSMDETIMAVDFMDNMKPQKTLCIETFAGSGQSKLNDAMVRQAMKLSKEIFGGCNFIFVSHKYLNGNENFPTDLQLDEDVYFARDFTVRQCAILVAMSNLLISVSSGITVAASAWDLKPVPIIQYTGSWVCSTSELAKGRRFELVTHDEKIPQMAEAEFFMRLESLLHDIK